MKIEQVKDNSKLSDNFTFKELYFSKKASELGIDNKIRSQVVLDNLQCICLNILEPLRKKLGINITISSGYRCELLNMQVGGSKNSQHMVGEAVDIVCGNNKRAYELIKDNFVFDQLIWEYGDNNAPDWVHVSLSRNKEKNRKQVLRVCKK